MDSVGVGLAAFGMLNPPLAAFLHVASELTIILIRLGFSGKRAMKGRKKTIALFKAIFDFNPQSNPQRALSCAIFNDLSGLGSPRGLVSCLHMLAPFPARVKQGIC